MRSIKLLAALAVPAMFAACTNEELFKVDNAPQQMEEVVGTKLIGTDVSLNASMNDAETRVNFQSGKFHADDVLGLAWLCTDDGPESDQLETGTFERESAHKLYANHMFNWDEEAGEFSTKGNLYQGWYFAYYPWGYEPKVAQKVFKVNPAQGAAKENQSALDTRKGQNLFISNRQFLKAEKVKDSKIEVPFAVKPVLSNIVVTTSPLATSSFATNEDMKAFEIESITINVDKTGQKNNGIFAEYLTLNAANIPAWTTTPVVGKTLDQINEDNLLASLYAANNPVFTVSNEQGGSSARTETVTTNVVGTGYTAGTDGNQLITIVAPTVAELDVDDIVIEIKAGSGKFVIEYTDAKNLTTEQAANNAAIQKLVNNYKESYKDGETTKVGSLTKTGKWVNIPVTLYDDIFVTDFDHISNIEEWNDAVKLVNTLGRAKETFKIDGTIVFTGTIPMPTTCKLTVERATAVQENRFVESLTLAGGKFYGWPETLTSKVYLTIAEDATVYDAHEIANQTSITNKGTIVVPDGAKDAVKTIGEGTQYTLTNEGTIKLGKYAKAQRVDNTDGRIEVIYGSYIELRNEAEAGEIAYVVMPEDAETPSRIKDVVATTGNDFGHASVNILVFDKENVTEFNFTKSINGKENDNPYNDNSSSADEDVLKLDGVSLEINGVAVTSSSTEEIVTVKNVTMTGAEASLTNVNVVGNLTVTDGGDVEVTTIAGDVKTDGDVTADAIAGGLTLSGNGVVSVKSIGGDVNVAGGEINATVAIAGNVTAAEATIVARTIEGDVTVNGDNTSIEGNKIKGKVDVTADGEVTLNVKTIEKALTNDGVVVIEGEEDVVIPTINNNATLTANTTINVHNITLKKGVANTTVQEDPEEIIWYTGTYNQGGTTTGKILPKPVTPETGTTVTVASPAELATAAIEDGATIALAAGEYVIPAEAKNKTVTFVGTGNPADVKVSVKSGLTYVNGADITFEGITIQSEPEGEGYNNGFAHLKHATFNNCVIDGTIGLYATCEFNGCTFNIEGNYYNVWTWGAGTAKFDECTFNSDGKALLVYANNPDNGTMHQTVNITNCIFNDNGDNTVNGKAAIEITSTYAGRTYDVKINNTAVNGFAQTVPGSSDFNADFGSVEGANIGTNVWGNKCQLSEEYLNVVVDGVDVY